MVDDGWVGKGIGVSDGQESGGMPAALAGGHQTLARSSGEPLKSQPR